MPVFCPRILQLRKELSVVWSLDSNRLELGFEHGSLDSQSRASFLYSLAVRVSLPKARRWGNQEEQNPWLRTKGVLKQSLGPGTWDEGGLSVSSLRVTCFSALVPNPRGWRQRGADAGRWQKPGSWCREDKNHSTTLRGKWNAMTGFPSLLLFLHYLRFSKWSHHRPCLQGRKTKTAQGVAQGELPFRTLGKPFTHSLFSSTIASHVYKPKLSIARRL